MTTGTQQPTLNLADLHECRVVIESAIQRGTFKASEVSKVGAVYDKLNSFVEYQTAAQQAAAEQAAQEEVASEGTEEGAEQ